MGKRSRLNSIYNGIKNRCNNPNIKGYVNYGGRGISICEEWNNSEIVKDKKGSYSKGYLAFREWALNNGYTDELSIDRIDVNGNYEPSNCRWVTIKVQNNNTRQNNYIEYQGQTKTLAEWCEEIGIKYDTAWQRLYVHHWSVEKVFTTKNNATLKLITYKGKTQSLTKWCKDLNLNYDCVQNRLCYLHWSVERAFEEVGDARRKK